MDKKAKTTDKKVKKQSGEKHLTGVSKNEEKKNTTPFRCFSPER